MEGRKLPEKYSKKSAAGHTDFASGTHTRTHTRTYTHIHIHTHTRIHIHTHTHAHTRTHLDNLLSHVRGTVSSGGRRGAVGSSPQWRTVTWVCGLGSRPGARSSLAGLGHTRRAHSRLSWRLRRIAGNHLPQENKRLDHESVQVELMTRVQASCKLESGNEQA